MDAVIARLSPVWEAMCPGCEFITPNGTGSVPEDGLQFLTITFPVSDEEMKTVGDPGNNTFREEGAFRVVLAAPIGTGLDPWTGYIDQLRTLFRAKVFDGITCFEATPAAIDDGSDQGGYIRLSFAVSYKFDYFG